MNFRQVLRCAVNLEILQIGQAIGNGFQRRIGLRKNGEEVFPRNGTIRRMNQLPPPFYRLLHFILGLGILDEAINEPVHLALNCLIRN